LNHLQLPKTNTQICKLAKYICMTRCLWDCFSPVLQGPHSHGQSAEFPHVLRPAWAMDTRFRDQSRRLKDSQRG
jgi:hypothetical protein